MDQLKDFTLLEKKLVYKASFSHIPLTANFELTPYCNLNCDMCFIRLSMKEIKQNGGLLRIEEWLDFAKSLKMKGTLFILLTGGEPLLYPHFVDLYKELRDMGFIITINTNATCITEDIAKLFWNYKPRRVNVTMYGGNEKTYDDLCHNKSGYNRCLTGLNLLRKYKIDVKLNITSVKKNIDDITYIKNYSELLGIPYVLNSYMFPCTRSVCMNQKKILSARLLPNEAAKFELDSLKMDEGNNFLKKKLELKKLLESEKIVSSPLGLDCRAGKSSCWINWQGKMSPCVAMEEPSISLREYSVDEAWNFIVEESQKLEKHTECAGCKLRPICDVCYAAACHEKKMVGNLSHLCEMAEWKKRYLLEE